MNLTHASTLAELTIATRELATRALDAVVMNRELGQSDAAARRYGFTDGHAVMQKLSSVAPAAHCYAQSGNRMTDPAVVEAAARILTHRKT